MLLKIYASLLCMFLLNNNAIAQDNQKISSSEVLNYSWYVGALAMKDHCGIKSKHREGDFELALKAIEKDFIQRGMSEEYLKKFNADSKFIATKPPYSACGPEVTSIVVDSFNKAWVRANEIVKNKS